MGAWLARARISEVDSVGQAVSTTLQAVNEAVDDRNWTAIAALQRLRYQHLGIAEKSHVTVEHVISDADLLRRITGGDEQKMGLLSSLLRPATFSQRENEPLLIEGQAVDDQPDDA
jgi:hypothetical protein